MYTYIYTRIKTSINIKTHYYYLVERKKSATSQMDTFVIFKITIKFL